MYAVKAEGELKATTAGRPDATTVNCSTAYPDYGGANGWYIWEPNIASQNRLLMIVNIASEGKE
jgi:hypothetical protein